MNFIPNTYNNVKISMAFGEISAPNFLLMRFDEESKSTYEGAVRDLYTYPRGIPYNGLYGEAPPERGTSFRLQVYERVGISLD